MEEDECGKGRGDNDEYEHDDALGMFVLIVRCVLRYKVVVT